MATPFPSDNAVHWRVFRMTVDQVREKFADIPADELDALLNRTSRVNAAEWTGTILA